MGCCVWILYACYYSWIVIAIHYNSVMRLLNAYFDDNCNVPKISSQFAHGAISILFCMYSKYNLKIGCLNIGGNAKVKCQTKDIETLIRGHGIFIILQSWLDIDDACQKIHGYMPFRTGCKKKSGTKRNSGGVLVYGKNTIAKGLMKLKSSSNDIMWIKLDKFHLAWKIICIWLQHTSFPTILLMLRDKISVKNSPWK